MLNPLLEAVNQCRQVFDSMLQYPTNQGFDYAVFPIHQQAQLALFSNDNHNANQLIGLDSRQYGDKFTLDDRFRPVPGAMVTAVEGIRGKPVREIEMQPGEGWTQQKYREITSATGVRLLSNGGNLPPKGENFVIAKWYDLFRDPREEHPVSTQIGAWGAASMIEETISGYSARSWSAVHWNREPAAGIKSIGRDFYVLAAETVI
jgi:hypothetical protein